MVGWEAALAAAGDAELSPGEMTLPSLMPLHADQAMFSESRTLWLEIINSSIMPGTEAVLRLMDGYRRAAQLTVCLTR